MILDLQPARGEAEYGDPALAGDWAAVLPEMLSVAQVAPWCSYAVRRDGALVGLGGFKGPPDDERVEIAYLTFRTVEGQGVAAAIAAELIRIAGREGVGEVIAHTLPEENASTRVLVRNGFRFNAPVEDPEDGTIWRWVLEL